MEITYLNNMPRRRNRHTANITTAGYLYFNSGLAARLEIDDSKRYKLAVIYKRGVNQPALIEDPEGNKISRQHNAFVIYIKNLQEQFGLQANQRVNLERVNTKKNKGFILKTD